MIISLRKIQPHDKDNKIRAKPTDKMADAMFMYTVTAGIFAFLVAVVFGARAKRYRSGYTSSEGHAASNE